MTFLLALLLTGWQGQNYIANGQVVGMTVQGTMQVTREGETFLPVYAVTFGKHKNPSKAWKTEAEAQREVELEVREDQK
jgi:hypothetical protein